MGMNSKKACVIGWPIAHSRSPLIHNYWLKHHNISGAYEKIAVTPENLPMFLDAILDGQFEGCNVTIPHKEATFDLVHIDDPATALLGSVNTVYVDDHKLKGISTDGQGFFNHLSSENPAWDVPGKTIAVYGAGGAARSIIAEGLMRGAGTILITNRTMPRARLVATELGGNIHAYEHDDFEQQLASTDLLINATALGMDGQPPLELSLKYLPQSAIVADIVYVPLQTRLLLMAQEKGLRTLDGLGMLLHQAVPGFEKWFGVTPQVTSELRELIVADINNQ